MNSNAHASNLDIWFLINLKVNFKAIYVRKFTI